MTTLGMLTAPPATSAVGGQWRALVVTWDGCYLTSAETPTAVLTAPDGTTSAPVATLLGTGRWEFVATLTLPGRYVLDVSTVEDAVAYATYALASTTAAGLPTADDCVVYMRETSWELHDIQDALDAEASAQRDTCRVPAAYPDSLRQALLRRVQRNLAMRRVPLAVLLGDSESGPTVVPGRDPEVRRFEGPYRKLGVG